MNQSPSPAEEFPSRLSGQRIAGQHDSDSPPQEQSPKATPSGTEVSTGSAATPPSSTSDSYSICQVTRKAMATEFVILLPSLDSDHSRTTPSHRHRSDTEVDVLGSPDLNSPDLNSPGAAVEAAVEAADLLEGIEADLTIYRPTSEISRINLLAGETPVVVSESTFSLLQRAVYWGAQTGGAFDVTAGPLVEAWGFTQRSGKKPTAQEIKKACDCVGYQHLRLAPADRSVAFAVPGMAINLGGIGKGDALDRLAKHLRSRGVRDFLIHGGNSSVIASGDQTPGSGLGWAVGLAHPTKPNRRLAGIWLRDQALATSGSGKQFFHHQGRRYGHVIDPRTGYPAGDLLSLTLLMDHAADADALATGLFVSGSEAVRDQFQQQQISAALMVHRGIKQDSASLETLGDFHWIDPPESIPPTDFAGR
ncbi:Thiamine biosynthesis lipoprotein ApbE precursor [Novipirellula galeiformis]|uniref:FAD:protein FMN transferase n=1 Tax=Novipirellula galeiformis TaxID=2528004 RepID=A0A5C6CR46_9BACT|nr:FAD:protein FMN transferase [Novipirellula galeiformis]TWU27040.1 Thiamine biosynthesis lipoprotein ApbE precursor [Novipirellula galeiformis]